MVDLKTQLETIERDVDRTLELSRLLLEMCREKDNERFWELNKQFKDLVLIYKLENEVNNVKD